VAESTQNQALGAILFLYRQVVTKDLGCLDAARRCPKVLGYRSHRNVNAIPLQFDRDDKTAIELFLSGVRALALQSSILDVVRIASWISTATG
jgi:hypothetical protein